MKILFLHPYGKKIGDWNHRLKRQVEVMSENCNLKVIGSYIPPYIGIKNEWITEVNRVIKNFKPDVIYVNGFLLAYHSLRLFDKIVYDMGSWKVRNVLIDDFKITYKDMRTMSVKQMMNKVNRGYTGVDFRKEEMVLKKAKAIIIWESEEAEFVEKIYDVKVNQISMMFYDLPKPIPFKQKKDYVIAISAKWGDRQKNHRLISHLNGSMDEKYRIHSVGHAGNAEKFVNHKELMDRVNNSKVVFCPYFCGGIGVINEGLKLGCNVITGDWHPYLTYVNPELVVNSDKEIKGRAITCIKKAMEKYYPPKKELPAEKEQVNKILKVCSSII